ncbi:hypothetical protein KP001_03590 [Geomonas subterranea]|uniref:Uncharacterized protein n=1 Tax=Geomonas subterranea TaxID=2847989 RepID=A0ABX8LJH6_9BACT|nr:hypothetical protein [Geomonas subterranea]QXE91639.1 hypothetical protein KP001_03590 [Geomonas subterranea]QXM10269.1 hypothetical protein KP002_03905 [Geomonas subterranea]
MGLIDHIKHKRIFNRYTEEQLYEIVHNELGEGVRKDGLWAKAISDSKGDEKVALARYISLRVKSLEDELYLYNQYEERLDRDLKSTKSPAPPTTPTSLEPSTTGNENTDWHQDGLAWFVILFVIVAVVVGVGVFVGL